MSGERGLRDHSGPLFHSLTRRKNTGPIIWGEPGTNGQHAFYQLLHQGTHVIPADFIAAAHSHYPRPEHHTLLLANYLAQTEAFMRGKTLEEAKVELKHAGYDAEKAAQLAPHKVFTGNRPTASIMAPALTPSVLGQLIALYEHITFTQGVVWGIDSFDQWGVELGKQLAQQVTAAVAGDDQVAAEQDLSTQALIAYYREHRS